MILFILYVFSLPGGPPTHCGEKRCEVGQFPTKERCEYAALWSEESWDPNLLVRCIRERR